jgi:ribosomal 50S subunit-recycling heat shock protein
MNSSRFSVRAACLAGALCLATVALAETPAAAPKGEAMMASVQVTATVTKIDQKTREVTVKMDDGQERSFVAGEEAKNLAQVKKGDRITLTYAEALVYEVKKGGAAVAPASAVAGKAAQPGMKPAGAIARQTTATVLITAIDPKAPSVTFKGAGGNTQTIKVMHPEKLQGVKVGDTVEITYTEALAIKVEEAPRK